MAAYHVARPNLTRRQQAEPWAEDGAGAVGRLVERCDQQQRELHQQARTIRQLRAELEAEQHRNALLRLRLAMKHTRKRAIPAEQLALELR